MRVTHLLGVGALMLGLTAAPTLSAQRVAIGVRFGGGPVAGRVFFGRRAWYPRYYPAPYPRPVIIDAYGPGPRYVVVDRLRVPRGRAWGWWRHHGYLQATLWAGDDGRYYDRDDARPGLREVTVYQRDGRYYQPDGDYDGGDR